MPQTVPTAAQLLASRSVSFWLKDALAAALRRDCIDAAADAALLAQVLADRRDSILNS